MNRSSNSVTREQANRPRSNTTTTPSATHSGLKAELKPTHPEPTKDEPSTAHQHPLHTHPTLEDTNKEDHGVLRGTVVEEFTDFDSLGLTQALLRGVYGYGFEKPSTIQSRAIKPLIDGRDVIAQAQSGSGKTGAFSIGTLQRIDPSINRCQALILCHTRELADQTAIIIRALSDYMGITCMTAIGGTSRGDMARAIKSSHVVVGTPGRLHDMMQSGALDCRNVKTVILDEADAMLSRGFLEQVQSIFGYVPPDAQVGLFSATMPPDVHRLSKQFMKDPVTILVKQEDLTLEGISQYFVDCERPELKMGVLCDLYTLMSVPQSIVFCNTRAMVERVASEMTKAQFTVSVIHSDISMQDRSLVMRQFRSGSTRVLITTDLIARGIDAQSVSLVINYELPRNDLEVYLHRIGRAGRFGRKGSAINLVARSEYDRLRELEQFYETKISSLPENVSQL